MPPEGFRGPRRDGRGRAPSGDVRAAVVQEGFDSLCTAPLFDQQELLGLLNVYHDTPHDWTTDELDTMAALAEQASIAIKNAQNYEKMATWAAQLQSIQQLGTRLQRRVECDVACVAAGVKGVEPHRG